MMAVKGVTAGAASLTMKASISPLEKTQLDRLIGNMPVGLVVEDEEGGILWVNETFITFVSKTVEQLHGTRVADLPLIRVPGAGGNPDFFQIECARKGGPEWLFCTSRRISQANGRGLIARFYLDATEHRRVQRFRGRQLSLQYSSAVIDRATGTPDRGRITEMLESEISRSRRYHNPLALIRLRLELCGAKLQDDGVDRLMSATARVLREQTRWVDRIGRWSEREFLLVLPESNALAAGSVAEKIQRHVAERRVSDVADDLASVTVRFGIAEWQRGDGVLDLLERAGAGLKADANLKAPDS
jgi:diguanylate cyclase (GGDEF)-like protein